MMKKLYIIFLTLVLAVTATACKKGSEEAEVVEEETEDENSAENSSIEIKLEEGLHGSVAPD